MPHTQSAAIPGPLPVAQETCAIPPPNARQGRVPSIRRRDASRRVGTVRRSLLGLGFGFLGLMLAGCSSIGPGTVMRDRTDYDAALSDSWKNQMLINIVRLRYADTPTFMDVSSIIGAYTYQAALQAGVAANYGLPAPNTLIPSGTGSATGVVGFNDRPTISYTPLTGKKFANSLLEPIPPSAIFSLIAAGYPADLVLPITVRALNGIYNRTAPGGVRVPSDPAFDSLVAAVRRIQLSRGVSLRVEKRGDRQVAIVTFAARLDPGLQRDIAFLRTTLNLKSDNGEVTLAYGSVPRSPSELAILSRSMLEVMNMIASDIVVPAGDVSGGRTYANAEAGVSTSALDAPPVKISSGATPPSDAFAAVQYRGTWYWISDHDYSSKRSLTFLLLFFQLAETGATNEAPVLTLPVQ